MKLDLKLDETHIRTVEVRIPWSRLQVIFAEEAARQAGMPPPHLEGLVNRRDSPVVAKVDYREEKGGSVGAGYTNGFGIVVKLTQDLPPAAAAPTNDLEPGDGH